MLETLARRVKQMAWCAAIALLLAGCTVELAYTNLDRLVIRWINDQVELTSDQSQWVRQALNENLDWHCEEHLPQYAELLLTIGQDIQNGTIDTDTLNGYGETMTRFGREIMVVSRPIATQLLASLSDEQVTQLKQSFDKSNQELVTRLSEPDQARQINDRRSRMERRLKRFMGRLSSNQQQAIAQWAEQYQAIDGHQLAYAYQWQAALLEALAIRSSAPEVFASTIEELFDPGRGWDDGYRQAVEFNQALTWQMMATVLTQTNTRQQQRLIGKIEGYADDVDALSCQGDPKLAAS